MYKLLSHNDLDGVSCGILAKLAFGSDVSVRYNSISGLNQEVEWFLENGDPSTFLFITDLSVNEENEQKLNDFYQAGGKVQLLDHHKTALHLNNYGWGHVVVEEKEGRLASATSLFYEYLLTHEHLIPSAAIAEFVELVRQYDTWEWEKYDNQNAKRLNALFFLVSIDDFEEKMITRLKTSGHFFFDEFEEKILSMEENKTERYIRRKRRELVQAPIENQFAGIVFAESYHSELGNELSKDCSHLDYIAIVNVGSKRISFRTIHDSVDVSRTAGFFGGGGHAKAAGCSLTADAFRQFVTETFDLEPLKEDAKRNRYNMKNNSFGALYENRQEELFLLYPLHEQEWKIEHNYINLPETFTSFQEGETFLKRQYAAWLVRDEVFVCYLMDYVRKVKD
ncbi:oligoribonuclease [Domibacillus sp. A3M-37]|uniref:DHH family phosphoesterase n=1 Tax=Domibacillus sp. A3M-37 TaxID=2962037 RepID=UPI0020B698AD|nr:oligoribonuclease [Domibacillus sp. A3M-37]MCP3762340.1 oligoribonuclease [Domibacillus sp. A3M-37]